MGRNWSFSTINRVFTHLFRSNAGNARIAANSEGEALRQITVEEAEKQFRARLAEVRGGASFSVVDNFVPVARLLPPPAPDHARDLAWLALKRHLGGCSATAQPRLWSRAALYRGKTNGEKSNGEKAPP